MLTVEALEREVAEKSFAELSFALSRKELGDAAETFFSYLSLPQEEKEKLHFYDRPENRQGIGYVRKDGTPDEVGRMDYKEFFHYHPKIEKEFAESALVTRPETKAFLNAGKQIYAASMLAMHEVVNALSKEFPHMKEAIFPTTDDYIEYSALRFLKYEPSGKGSFLARAHYDRGCMTLALAESAPGLRLGKNEETLKEVVHRDNVALFMPAYQLYALTDKRFLPAWHDVVQSSEDVYRADAARWAIVFFADAHGAPVPSKTEAHTPVI